MDTLPVELRNSFLPWEETEGSKEARIFRVWMPGVMGSDDPDSEAGWTEVRVLQGTVRGVVHDWTWRRDDTWLTLQDVVTVVENVALARGWNKLWALAQEAER